MKKRFDEIELASISLLIIGVILALATGSAVIYYTIATLTGVFFGRVLYHTRNVQQFKYYALAACFMIGFIIGNIITRYGKPSITLFCYIAGMFVTYQIMKKTATQQQHREKETKRTTRNYITGISAAKNKRNKF